MVFEFQAMIANLHHFKNILCATILLVAFSFTLQSHAASPRSRVLFNSEWSFARYGPMPDKSEKKEPKGIESSEYNDATWRKLDIPHDWGIEGPFRQDLEGNTGKLPWQGIGWYRKSLDVSEKEKGKRIFLDFDGAMANSKVYLNGEYVGGWPYGYNSFRVELTDHVKLGKKNVVAVRLDTEHWGSRWYPGAGIYRNVWLVKTMPVHVAHWGTYVTTPTVSKESATVKNVVSIDNQSTQKVTVKIVTQVFKLSNTDTLGEEVAKSNTSQITLEAGGTVDATLKATVKTPKLWNLKTPHRYLARTLVTAEGKLVDQYDTPFGIRTLKFTVKEGFYLNGKRVPLKGVCNHHDLGPLGSAVNTSALKRQIRILQEMGCNAIRTSHNPPAPELLDLCDKMGVMLIDETFDCWHRGKRKNDYADIFEEWHEKDTAALVLRDKNHPSVIIWSSGNEIPARDSKRGMEISRGFTDQFHKLDPTRPVLNGCNGATKHMKNGFQKTMDIYGFNYAIRGYSQFHKVEGNENQPFIGSETASTVSSRGEYFFPVNKNSKADFQVSSYDVQRPGWGCSPDAQFEALDKNPSCLGEFVWTGFDYLGEPTPYNKDMTNLLNFTDPVKKAKLKKELEALGKIKVPSRSSYFGIIDLCGLKKDRFYIYQARWRSEHPMAHLLPHWNWPERVGETTPVHLYTSGDEAELFLNGKSLGRKKKEKFQYRLQWDDVKYQPGTLKVVAYKDGKEWVTDQVVTTGNPTKINLNPEQPSIKADGKDLAFITVSVTDDKGNVVPRTHNQMDFKITGPGKIVAIGNGDATSHESFQAPTHKVFNGMAVMYLKATGPGTITITASSAGLAEKKLQINAE